MRLNALLGVAAISISASVLAGCGGPHWTVLKQADPNPLTKTSKFFVDKVSLEGMRVGTKSENEWIADKDAETKSKWDGDKVAMSDEFARGFDDAHDALQMAPAGAGAFTVRAHYVHYEPGYYVGVSSGNAEIQAIVDIVDPNGTTVDEFQVRAKAGGLAAGARARHCAHEIGVTSAKYLQKRVGLN